ncbi:MAG: hypothetical protein MZV70_03740 [Desulfobacterales bacterium]|nr:hypothetical protein [Desulfobacterales bacterium]
MKRAIARFLAIEEHPKREADLPRLQRHDPPRPRGRRRHAAFLEEEFGNPSSGHLYAVKPRQALNTARRQVGGAAELLAGGGCLHQRRHRGQQLGHHRHGSGCCATGAGTS